MVMPSPDLASLTPLRYGDAASFGLTPYQLRTAMWNRPAHGLYVPSGSAAALAEECAALQLVLPPDAVFTHATAARLRDWWLPDQLDDTPVIACSNAARPHHNRRAVYVRRCRTAPHELSFLDGIATTTPARTLAELAEDLSLVDLVIAMDCALRRGDCTIEHLAAAATPRRRGNTRFTEALELADSRSDSPWETILRLLIVIGGRVAVQPQYVIADAAGEFLAYADLRIVGSRRIFEYDGADHRDAKQHTKDLSREKVLARGGWERYAYTAVEIHRQPEQILADACTAVGRTVNQQALRRWRREYTHSSLTSVGRLRLERRMHRFIRTEPPRRRT